MMSMLTIAMVVVMRLVLVTSAADTEKLRYSCPVEKSYNFSLKNFSLKAASGPWYVKYLYGIEDKFEKLTLQMFSVSPDFVNILHTNIEDGKRCRIIPAGYYIRKKNVAEFTQLDETEIKDVTIKNSARILGTDYESWMLYQHEIRRNGKLSDDKSFGVMIRNRTSLVDWKAVTKIMAEICSPVPEDARFVFKEEHPKWNASCYLD